MPISRHCSSSSLTLKQPIYRPLAAAVALVLGTAAHAATFTVLNTNDNGAGSLRQAVIDASTLSGADNIVFDPALRNSIITLSTGQIEVSDELTITGLGDANSITIDGNNETRLFIVNKRSNARAPFTLENITLTGGIRIRNPRFSRHYSGSAISTVDSRVTLNNSVVIGNSNAAIYGYDASIILNQSVVTDNSTGIFIHYGSITLNQSTVSGNSGNGISVGAGVVTLNQSTASNNARNGINASYFSSLRLYQSTVSGNSGDGVSNHQYSTTKIEQSTVSGNSGTGVSISSGTIQMEQSTVSGNRDGGLSVFNGDVVLQHCTITDNTSDTGGGGVRARAFFYNSYRSDQTKVSLVNTVFANNKGPDGNFSASILNDGGASITLNASFSLFGDDVSEINGINTSNVFSDSPSLGLLQNNGGPTQTHLPGIRSPVLDAGNNADALFSFDQRGSGFPRIVNGTVDIGAVERQVAPPPPVAQPIPMLSLPALLSLITSFVALVGWRQRSG